MANENAHRAFREYSEAGFRDYHVYVGRYVIMPDHMHLFVRGHEDFDLAMWVRGLKRTMTRELKRSEPWQPGFFDHVIRDRESYEQKWYYVHLNPVRAGLVLEPSEWPYQGEIAAIEQF